MQIGAYQCLKPFFENKKASPFHQREMSNKVRQRDLNHEKEEVLDSCLQKWKYAEHSDARRQSTFFKTKSNAMFFDITDPDFPKKTISIISQWYNKS